MKISVYQNFSAVYSRLLVRLTLVGEKKKIKCFLGFPMQNLVLVSAPWIAGVGCPLVEEQKENKISLGFLMQNLLYPINFLFFYSLIWLKINKFVDILLILFSFIL